MRSSRTGTILLAMLLATLLTGRPEAVRAQDMMTTCAPEIGTFCSGVSRGRGRITACLISYADKLSAACNADLNAVAQSGSRNPLVPAGVRKMLGSGQTGAMPAVCAADAGKFCSRVTQTHEKVLACLYAHSNQVSQACSAGVQASLN